MPKKKYEKLLLMNGSELCFRMPENRGKKCANLHFLNRNEPLVGQGQLPFEFASKNDNYDDFNATILISIGALFGIDIFDLEWEENDD